MSNPSNLSRDKVAIVGYGSQGRAHAMNLRDSGWDVVVGARASGASAAKAAAEGFKVLSPKDATEYADLIAFLVPDMEQPKLWNDEIQPALKAGKCILFAHGFSIHFGNIKPIDGIDIVLVAPKGPGALVRRQYALGNTVPCLYAVQADASGNAAERAIAYAAGIGGERAGLVKTTFKEETETDLFGEQAVLCGGATELVLAGYETLVEAGYQPEVAYFECLHELKLIVDLLHEGGLKKMHQFISLTAQYGDISRGPRIIDARVRQTMKDILKEIQDGTFAKEFAAESAAGLPKLNAVKKAELEHPIEKVGVRLRAMMPWLESSETNPPAAKQKATSA